MRKNSYGNAGRQQETSKAIHSFMDMVAGEAEQYAAGHTSLMSPLLEEIESYTLRETDYPSMLTGRVEGRLLQLIVALSKFRDVVDIGTFTGYSALAMAESVPPDGKVLTMPCGTAGSLSPKMRTVKPWPSLTKRSTLTTGRKNSSSPFAKAST